MNTYICYLINDQHTIYDRKTVKSKTINSVLGKLGDWWRDRGGHYSTLEIHDLDDYMHPIEYVIESPNHLNDYTDNYICGGITL